MRVFPLVSDFQVVKKERTLSDFGDSILLFVILLPFRQKGNEKYQKKS